VTAKDALFIGLAAVTLGSAVLVVTLRNVIHAALWLVVCFGGLAGCYLVLTAELVAWVQVLIYVGAVVVLLLFGAMLTRAPLGSAQDLDSGNRPAAVVVAVGTAGVLVTLLLPAFRTSSIDLDRAVPHGSARAVGDEVFRNFVLPFEVASVLLLAALIGAVVLSRRDVT
jgi:NADH-quinone oxidoreductase subunit J